MMSLPLTNASVSTPAPHTRYQLRRGWRLQWEAMQGGYVILYPEGMVTLSPTAGAILVLVDGRQTLATIIATLQQRYPDADSLATDVTQFLHDAEQNGWLIRQELAHEAR